MAEQYQRFAMFSTRSSDETGASTALASSRHPLDYELRHDTDRRPPDPHCATYGPLTIEIVSVLV